MINPVAASSIAMPAGKSQVGQSAPSLKPDGEGGFGKLVNGYIQGTNEAQAASDQAINDLVMGKTDNVQQVVMAVANAEMSFQLFMEIRNKMIDSYNELMRMQF